MDHECVVVYTPEDDDIWISCTCGWEHCCGYCPTLDKLADEFNKHLDDVKQPSGM